MKELSELKKRLSEDLTKYYGKGFTKTNLYAFAQFYNYFPEIFHTVCGKSKNMNLDAVSLNSNKGILDSLSPKSQSLLSWSHYRTLLQVDDKAARDWYAKETFATRRNG